MKLSTTSKISENELQKAEIGSQRLIRGPLRWHLLLIANKINNLFIFFIENYKTGTIETLQQKRNPHPPRTCWMQIVHIVGSSTLQSLVYFHFNRCLALLEIAFVKAIRRLYSERLSGTVKIIWMEDVIFGPGHAVDEAWDYILLGNFLLRVKVRKGAGTQK